MVSSCMVILKNTVRQGILLQALFDHQHLICFDFYFRDVVVDIVCYRKHGHSEADQPKFTQPIMYKVIHSLKPVAEKYTKSLLEQGVCLFCLQELFQVYLLFKNLPPRLLEPEKIENIGNRIHTNPRGHVRYNHFRHNAEAELTHGTPGTHSRLCKQECTEHRTLSVSPLRERVDVLLITRNGLSSFLLANPF